jgi:hypothetical protein
MRDFAYRETDVGTPTRGTGNPGQPLDARSLESTLRILHSPDHFTMHRGIALITAPHYLRPMQLRSNLQGFCAAGVIQSIR